MTTEADRERGGEQFAARTGGEPSDCSAATRLDTLPKLLLHHSKVRPDRPAMREKKFGVWRCWTWRETEYEVRRIAATFSVLGFARHDRLAVLGTNRPLLYWSMIAAQALGGAAVPVYHDATAGEIADMLIRTGVRYAVAENQEQVDKLIAIKERCPQLERVFYADPRGLRGYREPFLQELATASDGAPEVFMESIAHGSGADPAGIFSTSGTAAAPKAVVLSFDNVLATARAIVQFEGLTEREDVLAWLPMAWIGDHMVSVAQAYCAGFCVNCPEQPATVMMDLREIGPTYFLAPPAAWDNIRSSVTLRMEDAGALKRWLYSAFMRRGRNGAPARLRNRLGETLVYGPLKNALGMSRVRLAHTSGEAISPATFDFIRTLGINLKQIYGSTEGALFIAGQADRTATAATVGRALPGVDLAIGDGGEVLFRSAGGFQEYCQEPQETAAAKTPDGWIRSGDHGFIDERGDLCIVDRADEAGSLADGTMFAPMQIENRFRATGPIREIVAFGAGRGYVAAFVTIDTARVGNWAERRGIVYANSRELAERGEVRALVRETIETINAELAKDARLAGAQVRRFLILQKEFDADDGELTRTRKLRRRYIAGKYAALVAALYADESLGEIAVVEAKVFQKERRDETTISSR